MAGLYSWYKIADGSWLLACTIITTASSGKMAELHGRMPVFLSEEMLEDWLDPNQVADAGMLKAIDEAAKPVAEVL